MDSYPVSFGIDELGDKTHFSSNIHFGKNYLSAVLDYIINILFYALSSCEIDRNSVLCWLYVRGLYNGSSHSFHPVIRKYRHFHSIALVDDKFSFDNALVEFYCTFKIQGRDLKPYDCIFHNSIIRQ